MREPFFFTSRSHRLFGCYHPAEGSPCALGVVICQPFGQEAIRAHRALFQLAQLLCRRGYHVLRFDYFASGDSEGRCEEADLEQWTENIRAAIDELGSACGTRNVALIGLRLGANLARKVAGERSDVSHVVAWCPIQDGVAYVEELAQAHVACLAEGLVRDQTADQGGEALGFPLPTRFRRALADVGRIEPLPTCRMLVLESAPSSPRETSPGPGFLDHRQVERAEPWLKSAPRVPSAVLHEIANWLVEAR